MGIVRDNALMAYQHKIPEWIPSLILDIEIFMANPEMERYTYDTKGKDAFGVEWTYVPEIGAPMPTPGKHLLDDITHWKEKVTIPNVDAFDWEKIAHRDLHGDHSPINAGKGVSPRTDGSNLKDTDKATMCMVVNGMFERLHSCMGMENALCSLLDEPEACYDFFGAVADYKIAYLKKIKQYYNPDIVCCHDDYGTQQNLFMSPDIWRELLKPHLARIVKACHDLGMIYEHHSCGRFQDLVPDMVEIEIDAIDSWQTCNDQMRQLKDKYQHQLTFVGGFDNVATFGRPDVTPEEIRAEYHRCAGLMGPGGSFVLFPSGLSRDNMGILIQEHMAHRSDYCIPSVK